jgi:PAB-dependent poly(A)-specific ribonuclease subunit 3
MATSRMIAPDMRRPVGTSPRPKGRENKDTPCRNITIYGHCRYINTCTFNHDQMDTTHLAQPDL